MKLDPQLVSALIGGAIGIAGSVVTLFAERIIRSSGRIHVTMTSFNGTYDEDFNRTDFQIGMDFYNSSETPKSLRGIKIKFIEKDGRKPVVMVPLIVENGKLTKELEIINVQPKQLIHYDITCDMIGMYNPYTSRDVCLIAEHPVRWYYIRWPYKSILMRYVVPKKKDINPK